MKVSVIIPVYNAEDFLRDAVESALAQTETGEVLLIEDCSRDGSLRVCQQLANEFSKVCLLRHSPPLNRGAGASRNLGIRNARFNYVAFLDADDFYLPGRFTVAAGLFAADPQLDAVYETVGTHFENDDAKQAWLASGRPMVTSFRHSVAPEDLFEDQGPVGDKGYAHINGWLLRKTAFARTGPFNENLRLHQDTAMAVKLAALCRIAVADTARPVAMRRVHARNRITAERSQARIFRERLLLWRVLWQWGKIGLQGSRRELLLRRYLIHASLPFTEFECELWRISLVPFCQLIYAMVMDVNLIREVQFRDQLHQCIRNFRAYVGWVKQ